MSLKIVATLSALAAILLIFATLYVAKTIADAQVRRLNTIEMTQ